MSDDFTQENKLISLSVEGEGEDDLLLQSFMGTESISRPYLFQLEVLTTKTDLDFSKILGKRASITLQTTDGATPRYFNGFISRFVQTDAVGGFNHYRVDVVPWIWFLSLEVDCLIFHNMTIPEIVKKVLTDFPGQQKDSFDDGNIQGTYPKLEYCVQYRESSLSFISRLMEHAGIFYYFTHTDSIHTLHLSDTSSLCDTVPNQSSISYLFRNAGEMHEETVLTLHGRQEIKTGAYANTSYNFKTPSTDLKTSESTVVSVAQNSPLEIFEYPSPHTTIDEGKALSRVRMQEHEASYNLISGSGHVRNFIPGHTFTLKDHPQDDAGIDRNIEYVITEVQHMITTGGSYVAGVGGETYSNQFGCIPSSVPYRPARLTPKPSIFGVQTAVVIGKGDDKEDSSAGDDGATGDGEEIWVDKYGRIIVRFPWDRAGNCSCRARVSQQWAGQKWGAMAIPRVGQEVLVSFINGDPDQPIVTGCVYNSEQSVPYDLPDHQTRSTFKTHSSKGGGDDNYNELRFEDKKGDEQVFIRGEKDYDTRIKNDSREWIGNNQSTIIIKSRMEKVGEDESLQITGDRLEKVGGDDNLDITGNLNQKAGQNISIQAGQNLYGKSGTNYAHEAGTAIHIKAGTTMVLEAGIQLSLKVGSNFIDIGPAGVSIQGTMVMINSGGSAGSGGGSSPTSPSAPKDPDEADDGSKGTKM